MKSLTKPSAYFTLHYQAYGSIHNPQIILLHGIATNGSMWTKLIQSLQAEYFVVSVDLLGHGKSPKPKDVDYTAQLQAESVYQTLRQAGLIQQSTVIGFSIGALIAAHLTARYHGFVSRAIFLAPPVYEAAHSKIFSHMESTYFSIYNLLKRLPEPTTLRLLRAIKQTAPALIGNNEFTHQTWQPIMSSVSYTVQQQCFKDDIKLIPANVQVYIMHGSLDHLVLKSRLRTAAASRPETTIQKVHAPHALTRKYVAALESLIVGENKLIPAEL